MAKLTVKELECLSSADIGSRIRDEGSRRGTVRRSQQSKTGVSVTFVYRFSWEKSYPEFPCGTWPSDSLAVIRGHLMH